MVNEKTAKAVIELLVFTGRCSPLDIGVCVLGEPDGKRAWNILNAMRAEGYVSKVCYGTYTGRKGVAAAQIKFW